MTDIARLLMSTSDEASQPVYWGRYHLSIALSLFEGPAIDESSILHMYLYIHIVLDTLYIYIYMYMIDHYYHYYRYSNHG